MLLIKINDFIILNYYLLFLTKSFINIILLILFIIFFQNTFLNKKLIHLITLILCKKILIKSAINIPLSNTIFLVHPIGFFYFWVYVMFNFSKSFYKIFNFPLFSILLLILFLGGYWSVQEFNWGGWWNWDILEVFSLTLVLILLLFTHTKANKVLLYTYNFVYIFAYIGLTYYIFNKAGLSTSIHSFIKSNKLSNNWHLFILYYIFLMFFIKKNILFLVNYFIILTVFLYLSNFFALKIILTFSILYIIFFNKFIVKKINYIAHTIFDKVCYVVIIFNFLNNSFIFTYYYFYYKSCLHLITYNATVITGYFESNHLYYYNDAFVFKVINICLNNYWLFFVKKIFNSLVKGLLFF